MLKEINNILVLSPHTDDGELGAGGTISKLVENGAKVTYGAFSIAEESVPEGLPKNKWRGSHQWEVGNDYVQYISTNIHDGHAEVIEITSKLYANVMADYNSKVGEWLDSRK